MTNIDPAVKEYMSKLGKASWEARKNKAETKQNLSKAGKISKAKQKDNEPKRFVDKAKSILFD